MKLLNNKSYLVKPRFNKILLFVMLLFCITIFLGAFSIFKYSSSHAHELTPFESCDYSYADNIRQSIEDLKNQMYDEQIDEGTFNEISEQENNDLAQFYSKCDAKVNDANLPHDGTDIIDGDVYSIDGIKIRSGYDGCNNQGECDLPQGRGIGPEFSELIGRPKSIGYDDNYSVDASGIVSAKSGRSVDSSGAKITPFAAPSTSSAMATGGTITFVQISSSPEKYREVHTFTGAGTFAPKTSISSAQYLVIGGGGSGGGNHGGGGGAGAFREGAVNFVANTNYSAGVGPGGTAPTGENIGNNGGSSTLAYSGGTITAEGGGGGGTRSGEEKRTIHSANDAYVYGIRNGYYLEVNGAPGGGSSGGGGGQAIFFTRKADGSTTHWNTIRFYPGANGGQPGGGSGNGSGGSADTTGCGRSRGKAYGGGGGTMVTGQSLERLVFVGGGGGAAEGNTKSGGGGAGNGAGAKPSGWNAIFDGLAALRPSGNNGGKGMGNTDNDYWCGGGGGGGGPTDGGGYGGIAHKSMQTGGAGGSGGVTSDNDWEMISSAIGVSTGYAALVQYSWPNTLHNGKNGGSGGGGSNGIGVAGSASNTSYGNGGGNAVKDWRRCIIGGGGGGAGAAGTTPTYSCSNSTVGGAGGAGKSSSLRTGSAVTYAGGGGGGSYSSTTCAAGGLGGGGAGGCTNSASGKSATANSGSGGGGGGAAQPGGGAGGSGIVIVSFDYRQQIQVAYNLNGGSGTAPATQTVYSGDSFTLPSYTGTKTGLTFKGWATTGYSPETSTNSQACLTSANLKAAGSTFSTLTAVTLYACWKDETGPNAVATPTITVPTVTTKSARISVSATTDPGNITPAAALQYRVEIGTTACATTVSSPLSNWTTRTAAFTVDYAGFTAGTEFSVSVCVKDAAGNVSAIKTQKFTIYSATYNVNTGSGSAPATQYAVSGGNITTDNSYSGTKDGYTLQNVWTTSSAAPSNSATSCAATTYNKNSSVTLTSNLTLYACFLDKTAPDNISNFTPTMLTGVNATISFTPSADVGDVTSQSNLAYRVVSSNNTSGSSNSCLDDVKSVIIDWTTNKTSGITWDVSDHVIGDNYVTVCVRDLAGNVNQTTITINNPITLTYDANGGTSGTLPNPNPELYYSTSTIVTVANDYSAGDTTPGRVGYTFSGWSTQNTVSNSNSNCPGITYQSGDQFELTQNTTLYACWIDKSAPFDLSSSGISVDNTVNAKTSSSTIKIDELSEDLGNVTPQSELQYKIVTSNSSSVIANCSSGTVIFDWSSQISQTITYDALHGLRAGNNYITVCVRDNLQNVSQGQLYTFYFANHLETHLGMSLCGRSSTSSTCTQTSTQGENWRVDDANGTQKVRLYVTNDDPTTPSPQPAFSGDVTISYTLPYGAPTASNCNSSTRVCTQTVSNPTWVQAVGRDYYTYVYLSQSIYAQNMQINFSYSGSTDGEYNANYNSGYISNIVLDKIPSKTIIYTGDMKKNFTSTSSDPKTTADIGTIHTIVVPETCNDPAHVFDGTDDELNDQLSQSNFNIDLYLYMASDPINTGINSSLWSGTPTAGLCLFTDNGNGGGQIAPNSTLWSQMGRSNAEKLFVPNGKNDITATPPSSVVFGNQGTTLSTSCYLGAGVQNQTITFLTISNANSQYCRSGLNDSGNFGLVKPAGTWSLQNVCYVSDEPGHIDENIASSGSCANKDFSVERYTPSITVDTSSIANLTPNSPEGTVGENMTGYIYITLPTGLYTVDPPTSRICAKNDLGTGSIFDLTDPTNPKCASGTLIVSNEVSSKIIGDGTNGVALGFTKYAYSVQVVGDIDNDGDIDKLPAGNHTLSADIIPDTLVSSSSSSSSSYVVNASAPQITMYTRDTAAPISNQADIYNFYENIIGLASNISDLHNVSVTSTNNTIIVFVGVDTSATTKQFISNGVINITLSSINDPTTDLMGSSCKNLTIYDDGFADGYGMSACKFPNIPNGGSYTYTVTFVPDQTSTGLASDSQVLGGSKDFLEDIWADEMVTLQFTDGDPIVNPASANAKDFEDLIYDDKNDLNTSKIYTASNAGVGDIGVPSTGQCGTYGSHAAFTSADIPDASTAELSKINAEKACIKVQGFLYSSAELNRLANDSLFFTASGINLPNIVNTNVTITGSATKVKENGTMNTSNAASSDSSICINALDCYRIPFSFYLPQLRDARRSTGSAYAAQLQYKPAAGTQISTTDFSSQVSEKIRPKASTLVNKTTLANSTLESALACNSNICSAAKNDYFYRSNLAFVPESLTTSPSDTAEFTIYTCNGVIPGLECDSKTLKALVLAPGTSTEYSHNTTTNMLDSGIHTMNAYSSYTSSTVNTPFGKLDPGIYQLCTRFKAPTSGLRMFTDSEVKCQQITVVKADSSLVAGQNSDPAGERTSGASFTQSIYNIDYNAALTPTINITPEGYNPLLDVSSAARIDTYVCKDSWNMPTTAITLADKVAAAASCDTVDSSVTATPVSIANGASFNMFESKTRSKVLNIASIHKAGTYKLIGIFRDDIAMHNYFAISTIKVAPSMSKVLINNCVPTPASIGESVAWAGGVSGVPNQGDDNCVDSMLFTSSGSGTLNQSDRTTLTNKGLDGSSTFVHSPNRKVYMSAMSNTLSTGNSDTSDATLISDLNTGSITSMPMPESNANAGSMYLNVYDDSGVLINSLSHQIISTDILNQHKLLYGSREGGIPIGSALYGFNLPELPTGNYYLLGCFSGDNNLGVDCYSYAGREITTSDFIATSGSDAFKLTSTASQELFASTTSRSVFRQIAIKPAPYGDITGYFAGTSSGGVATQCATTTTPTTLDITQYVCIEVKTASTPETDWMASYLDNIAPGDATVNFSQDGVNISTKTCTTANWARVGSNTYQCLIVLNAVNDETIIKSIGSNANIKVAVDTQSTFIQKIVSETLSADKSDPLISIEQYSNFMSATCQTKLTADCKNFAVKVKVTSPADYPAIGSPSGDIKGSGAVKIKIFGPSTDANISSHAGINDGMGAENTLNVLSSSDQAGVQLNNNGEAIIRFVHPPIGFGEGKFTIRVVDYSGDVTFNQISALDATDQAGGIANQDGTKADLSVSVSKAITHIESSVTSDANGGNTFDLGDDVRVKAGVYFGSKAEYGSVCNNLITNDPTGTGEPMNKNATYEIALDVNTNVVASGNLIDISNAQNCAQGYFNINTIIDKAKFTSSGTHTIFIKFIGNDWFDGSTATNTITANKLNLSSLKAEVNNKNITTARIDLTNTITLKVLSGINPTDGEIETRLVKSGSTWQTDEGVDFRLTLKVDSTWKQSSCDAGLDCYQSAITLPKYINNPDMYYYMLKFNGNSGINAFPETNADFSNAQFTVDKAQLNISPAAPNSVSMTNKTHDYVNVAIDIPDYTTFIDTTASPTQITNGKLKWFITKDNSLDKIYEGEISVTDSDCVGVAAGTNSLGCFVSPTTALDPTTALWQIPLMNYDRPGTYQLYMEFAEDSGFDDSNAMVVVPVVITQGDDVIEVKYHPGFCGSFGPNIETTQYYVLSDTRANGGTTIIGDRIPRLQLSPGCKLLGWTTVDPPDYAGGDDFFNFLQPVSQDLELFAQYSVSAGPQLSLSKTRFKHEEDFDVHGINFAPNELVQINIHSTPFALGSVTADASGSFDITVQVAKREISGIDVGNHTVAAKDLRQGTGGSDVSVDVANGVAVVLYSACIYDPNIESDDPACVPPNPPNPTDPPVPPNPPNPTDPPDPSPNGARTSNTGLDIWSLLTLLLSVIMINALSVGVRNISQRKKASTQD